MSTFAEFRAGLLALQSPCMLAAAQGEAMLRAEYARCGYPAHIAEKALELARELARCSNLTAEESIRRVRRISA